MLTIALKSGDVFSFGQVLSASSPRAIVTDKLVGLTIPIDPSGIHLRENGGGTRPCSAHSTIDPSMVYDDVKID